IHVQNVPSCYIIDPLIEAPEDSDLPLSQAIYIATGARLAIIRGGNIRNWPRSEDATAQNSAIHITGSVEEVRIEGTRIENCGWRGITTTLSTSGILRIRDVDLFGENITDSIGISTTGSPGDFDLEVSDITVTGYETATRYGSVTSTEGLELKRN